MDGFEYRVEVEEDPEEERKEALARMASRGAPPPQLLTIEQAAALSSGKDGVKKKSKVDAITDELKNMSADELRF